MCCLLIYSITRLLPIAASVRNNKVFFIYFDKSKKLLKDNRIVNPGKHDVIYLLRILFIYCLSKMHNVCKLSARQFDAQRRMSFTWENVLPVLFSCILLKT